MEDKESEKLAKSLLKKAMGYTVDEVVEEYVSDENEMKLVKKKVTTKHIPPDINAARALLEKCLDNDMDHLRDLSDAELDELRNKVLEEIKLKGGVK
ncbi:MAG: hypothetical protein IJ301_01255 [Clostridia bacterium]|nr:hypothetical protein [Clostridia bacterium]